MRRIAITALAAVAIPVAVSASTPPDLPDGCAMISALNEHGETFTDVVCPTEPVAPAPPAGGLPATL